MEVTETRSEGLARELKVVVPAATLEDRLTTYLDDMRTKVRLKGFRPGKVPVAHLRRLYGRSAMAEVIQEVVQETIQKTVEGRDETPALQPDIDVDEEGMKDVVDGKGDLSFAIKYEVLPAIEVGAFEGISVDRPVAEIAEEDVDAEVKQIAEQNRAFAPVERAAQNGDRLQIDFLGKVDGVAFDGGAAEDVEITIGEGRFIPGFEEQLVGASTNEDRVVTVTFPEDYPAKDLAGKEAAFDVKVRSVSGPQDTEINDALAERLGLESLEALKTAIRSQFENIHNQASRQKVKRALLDALDERYTFELPQKLVDTELNSIWRQLEADMERSGETFAEEGDKSEAALREEYGKIAERRVRLGLLLSEVGTKAEVQVTEEEVQRALQERLRQFPGREREVFDLYKKNPQAIQALRAPIFEDKVIDYILELVTVNDKTVAKEELLATDEDDPLTRLEGAGAGQEQDPADDDNQDQDQDHR